ncbi:EAL domain-containing protein [Billgrantia gudaonensis]|uniref:PAS domain S-box-containing protein/diguanylate cyclase (GGDEF) domain-containing protein n=1 Tax=Billgrantia gudaonensis TaxID=376427 RepID=A0A1G8YCP6_9GAMM|nr:EAL domain-containing protein [Halomonas gudaonensis]SDK00005.1 PAS domain S-box-containing protein/diguanylate cyclase (GGDEF) domain-containing protein [Halomonas gudaonensis]
MQARCSAEEAFRQLAEGLSERGAADFFDGLVAKLASLLDVDHVLIARIHGDGQAHTLSLWSRGAHRTNRRYPLAGTPCATVVGRSPCLYPHDVQTRFPDDPLLQQLGAESYLGLPLFAVDGTPLGLLAVLKNRPMTTAGLDNEILRLAAAQAGAELDRQQAQSALQASEGHARESERRLDTLLNHLPGMAYRCLNDHAWTMTILSRGAETLTGYPIESLIDNRHISYAELIHPDDRERLFEEVQAAIARRTPFRMTYRLRRADGSLRWMWEQGQAVFNGDGEVTYLEGFITDVTEQHEAQRVQDAVMQVASTITPRLGDDYFHQLIRTLVEILGADAGIIALLDASSEGQATAPRQRSTSMSTVSAVIDGRLLDADSFPLPDSPCARILDEREAMAMEHAGIRLPGSPDLVRSWIGRRLDNAHGEPIGVIMVLYRQPLDANAFATSVLRILSTGAAAELERRRDHSRMHQLAYIDGITGLPNRVRFMEELARLRQEAEQGQFPLGLLLLDIRRFKEINDIHGHQVGDQLLATLAGRLQRAATRHESLARLSGDEFALLVPDADDATLDASLARVHEAIGHPVPLGRRRFTLEVSIGMARYPDDATTTGDLFKSASIALYHAKQKDSGICPFDISMTHELKRRQQMTERLSDALQHHRLTLHFQPQIDLRNGQLVGAEALCRWYEEEWGWVSPGEFIPLAEERGLIRALGDWVLTAAARQLMEWQRAGTPLPGRLSVNVSAQQFTDPQLASHIASLAEGVPASAIALELTESDFMRDPEQAVAITQALRNAGYALAIDDFGTGYSSLSYLRRFAADALKIDISFVHEMLDSHHARTIVETIIAMAQALGMQTVAEGVECREQAVALAEMGCDHAQGYHFDRPLPADAFTAAWGHAMRPRAR